MYEIVEHLSSGQSDTKEVAFVQQSKPVPIKAAVKNVRRVKGDINKKNREYLVKQLKKIERNLSD